MDKQINKLARQLRDDGVAPERDLLPGIWESIGDARPEGEFQSGSAFSVESTSRRNFNSAAGWRMAAVAATLILLFGSGYFQSHSPGRFNSQNLTLNENQHTVGNSIDSSIEDLDKLLLRSLNKSISDLARAQALDPDNLKLTRLSLLTHKSRANFLRAGSRR